MDLHYGRDDFASQDRLARTLSRDRAKDMASDYERADPAQSYAERRGITFRERVAEIVRKVVPEKVRDMFDGLRSPSDVPGTDGGRRPEQETPERERSGTAAQRRETEAPERKVAEDAEKELRRVRTRALVRHARAVETIFEAQEMGRKASPEQVKELQKARRVFEEVRPYGSVDAEAAYKKDPDLASEVAGGRVNRAIRALQLETELRIDPGRYADRFVERWQKLDQTSLRQYQAGDFSGYKATRSAMGDMARSLERDPQLESLLENRKRELGITFEIRPPARPGTRLLPRHRPRQRPGPRNLIRPIYRRLYATARRGEKLSCAPCKACPVWSQKPSKAASRRQRGHARTRSDHPFENRPREDRAVPLHHLPQDRRGHVPDPNQDQHQRDRLA